ncbi:adhesion G protein-coupled receptor L2-like [Stegodyphus dumicola]|uniref:adhesion G protein-coupled receptor L2-like n=1 Tax=Stegodyphus dumicola TaxID=202533 RepID=UPI0015B07D82|nr:adhesion G protein-coupled receptor L2-like [Stegodyphus dumicola]
MYKEKKKAWDMTWNKITVSSPFGTYFDLAKGKSMDPLQMTSTIEDTIREIMRFHFPEDDPNQDSTYHADIRAQSTEIPNSEDDQPFTLEEMQRTINSTRRGKAPGLDGLTIETIEELRLADDKKILSIFNKCLELDYLPKEWKNAELVLFQKEGKPKSMPSSYRPICLLSAWGKVLDKMLTQRLTTSSTETSRISTLSSVTTSNDEDATTSSKPGNKTPSTSSLLPKPLYCMSKEASYGNTSIKWPTTRLGEKAEVLCPRGSFGFASRLCNKDTGEFEENPEINCEIFSCSKPPPENKSSESYKSYMAEYLKKCPSSHSEKEVLDFMNDMEKERKIMERNASYERKTAFVRTAIEIYDRFLDEDTSVWQNIGKEKRVSMSLDLIKATEETAWLIACTNTITAMKEDNIAMQVFPVTENVNKVAISLSSTDVGYVHLPGNLKAKTEDICEEPVQNGVASAFKNIQQLLSPENSFQTYTIATGIIGISLGESNDTYRLPQGSEKFRIVLYHAVKPVNAIPRCVFINRTHLNKNTRYGVWDTTGCTVITSSDSYTECECNHLTNFAILMDFTGDGFSEEDERNLSLLSLIFSCLSLIALTLTITLFLTVRSLRCRRNIITCNLAICLLCINILVQSGLKKVGTKVCMVISGLLQYAVLAAFFWMLLEGILLYRLVIVVYEVKKIRLPLVYGLAYGIPFFIVLLSCLVRPEEMIREKYCWPSNEKGMIWSVMAPIGIIISVNFIIFGLALFTASRIDKMNSTSNTYREKKTNMVKRLKGMASLMCLLGLTWAFGFFHVPNSPAVSAYIFVILNGLQGVYLFLTQIALNEHIRHKLLFAYKEKAAQFSSVITSWHNIEIITKANNKVHGETKKTTITDVRSTLSEGRPSSVLLDDDICRMRHACYIQLNEQLPSVTD